MTFAENSCYARKDSDKQAAWDNGLAKFMESAFVNSAYEVGGALLKRAIDTDPATA